LAGQRPFIQPTHVSRFPSCGKKPKDGDEQEKAGEYGKRNSMNFARVHSVSSDQDQVAEKRE
jgi:hypothetical protein